MKIAIVSDTHFGDPMCGLVCRVHGQYQLGSKYDEFRAAAGTGNDFLVVLGDIFDFSIACYAEAFAAGQVFFTQVAHDSIAKDIIYVPGNHDFSFWHFVEYEVNVLNQISTGKLPRDFRGTVPGVIDQRSGTQHPGFRLPTVTARSGRTPRYGGLFLDHLIASKPSSRRSPVFNVAYPNLYVCDDNLSILITHGHYLEPAWALLSEVGPLVVGQQKLGGDFIDLEEMVKINFPLNQLLSSGVGQAGPLTTVVRQTQQQIKDGQLHDVERYVNNLDDLVDGLTDFGWYNPKEWLTDLVSNTVKEALVNSLRQYKSTRYNTEFARDPLVVKRLKRYYAASLFELHLLGEEHGYGAIPRPTRIIFGHTHDPVPWTDRSLKMLVGETPVRLHNTGGWLFKQDNEWTGAEVFRYRDGSMDSVRV
jgi:UDP-2,3-diacylglucosamine pyrophosphatase LpxH